MQATAALKEASAEEVAASLSALWVRLMKGTTSGAFAVLEELDLQTTHLKMLMMLRGLSEDVSVKGLSEHMGLSLPAVSRSVEALLQRGYVERREDERDRRMKRVAISPAGLAVVERFDAARLVGLEAFAASLTPEQRSQLHAAIATLDLTPACQS